jgi:hypothetical protein
VLRISDFLDLAGIGCASPPPHLIEFMDDAAMVACGQAGDAILARCPHMLAAVANAAERVNACTAAQPLLNHTRAWPPMEHAGIYQWAAVPAAWGADVLADNLTPLLNDARHHAAVARAITRLAELRDSIMAGRNWWPNERRAWKALAAVPVLLTIAARQDEAA